MTEHQTVDIASQSITKDGEYEEWIEKVQTQRPIWNQWHTERTTE